MGSSQTDARWGGTGLNLVIPSASSQLFIVLFIVKLLAKYPESQKLLSHFVLNVYIKHWNYCILRRSIVSGEILKPYLDILRLDQNNNAPLSSRI